MDVLPRRSSCFLSKPRCVPRLEQLQAPADAARNRTRGHNVRQHRRSKRAFLPQTRPHCWTDSRLALEPRIWAARCCSRDGIAHHRSGIFAATALRSAPRASRSAAASWRCTPSRSGSRNGRPASRIVSRVDSGVLRVPPWGRPSLSTKELSYTTCYRDSGMKATHRILIAAQPHASEVLQAMLSDTGDLVGVHTTADAFRILEQQQIDLIVSTIAFDDSRMLEFLVSVKGAASLAHIPFLCSRVVVGALRDSLVGSMRGACKACGAVDFVDIARLPPDLAEATLRKVVETHLHNKSPGPDPALENV
jgi:CheY-like chemotaxis protein